MNEPPKYNGLANGSRRHIFALNGAQQLYDPARENAKIVSSKMEQHRLHKGHAQNSTGLMGVMGNYMNLPESYNRSSNEPLYNNSQSPRKQAQSQVG